MAMIELVVDTSDYAAVIKAAAALADRLSWPHRENFRSEIDKLLAENEAMIIGMSKHGQPIEFLASPILLDLMREYESK